MSVLLFLAKVLVILATGFLAWRVLQFFYGLHSALGRGRGLDGER